MSKHGRHHQEFPLEVPSNLLERVSDGKLREYRLGIGAHRNLQNKLYFGLEQQRSEHAAEIAHALRLSATSIEFESWCRIVPLKYTLSPLSTAGSLALDGGRFNIGRDLNPAVFSPFPALYLANCYDTAFAEKYAMRADEIVGGLVGDDLLLRKPSSFSHVRLRGLIEQCIDIRELESLRGFTKIIAKFSAPEGVQQLARRLTKAAQSLVRSPSTLRQTLLDPNWNRLPMHFDLPSNSQVFGRLAATAGLHGIIYPSARMEGGTCIALYPQNWQDSLSWVEAVDELPPDAISRIDGIANRSF